jgi:hypothetical protein
MLEAGNRFLRLGLGKNPVGRAPDDERRHVQLRKSIQQHLALSPEVDLGTQCRDNRF